jgi:FixJ family two-component response regulator
MSAGDVSTVFIIDDDAGVRESIQDLVESVGLHAESFATAQKFLSNERQDGPSCLVLDVRLPDTSGLDLQQKLSKAGVRIPIIFITGHADIPMTVKAMKSGAVEFLTKPFREQDLLDVIQRALRRDRGLRERQRQLVELQERYTTLSAREREVMSLVVSGRLNKQIAAELGASETTVKIHRGRVMQKMQAKSLPDLVRMADRLKISSHR